MPARPVTTVYFVYTGWCGYCKEAMPEWKEFETLTKNDDSINTFRINLDEPARKWSDFLSKHVIRSIPTILIKFGSNTAVRYNGKITSTALGNYIHSRSKQGDE